MNTLRFLAILALSTSMLSCSSGSDERAAPGAGPKNVAPAGEKAAAPIKLEKPTNSGPGFLTAFADVDQVVGEVPHSVKLGVEVVDGTGQPPFTYKWDFGDATEFSTDQRPAHVYKIPGSFRASVIVTDGKGQTDQDYVDITVNEDFEYAVTPDQLREALPLDDLLDKAQKAQKEAEKQKGAAKEGKAAASGAHPPGPQGAHP